MSNMDVINEICSTAVQLYSTKKYQFFKRYKLNKKIEKLSKTLYSEDIFKVSDCMLSFLTAIPDDFLKESRIHLKQSNLEIEFDDIQVNYNSSLRTVYIYDGINNIYYCIHKGSRVPNIVLDKWATIEKDIRSFYMAIIIDIALVFSTG